MKVCSEYMDHDEVDSQAHFVIAAIYAQARALMDWNTRNTFCGTCGHRTLSVNAGTKRACPPTDAARTAEGLPQDRPECNTRTTLSNLSFPRTDPTIIVAVVSADGKRILLGRGKRFPPKWYSTLAGFIEPAESIEDAVRREVWEEAGVTLSRVVIHPSQPWPYPANLMIGGGRGGAAHWYQRPQLWCWPRVQGWSAAATCNGHCAPIDSCRGPRGLFSGREA